MSGRGWSNLWYGSAGNPKNRNQTVELSPTARQALAEALIEKNNRVSVYSPVGSAGVEPCCCCLFFDFKKQQKAAKALNASAGVVNTGVAK